MKAAHKRSFYLDAQIEEVLAKAPPKKVSERANELMHKGLLKEKKEAMALEYKRHGEAIAKQSSVDWEDDLSTSALAYRLFEDDGSNDEGLI
jgi:hypothetical protein